MLKTWFTDKMAEEIEGDEFIVDKILDKRSRNGKIEYYLSWKVGHSGLSLSSTCLF